MLKLYQFTQRNIEKYLLNDGYIVCLSDRERGDPFYWSILTDGSHAVEIKRNKYDSLILYIESIAEKETFDKDDFSKIRIKKEIVSYKNTFGLGRLAIYEKWNSTNSIILNRGVYTYNGFSLYVYTDLVDEINGFSKSIYDDLNYLVKDLDSELTIEELLRPKIIPDNYTKIMESFINKFRFLRFLIRLIEKDYCLLSMLNSLNNFSYDVEKIKTIILTEEELSNRYNIPKNYLSIIDTIEILCDAISNKLLYKCAHKQNKLIEEDYDFRNNRDVKIVTDDVDLIKILSLNNLTNKDLLKSSLCGNTIIELELQWYIAINEIESHLYFNNLEDDPEDIDDINHESNDDIIENRIINIQERNILEEIMPKLLELGEEARLEVIKQLEESLIQN